MRKIKKKSGETIVEVVVSALIFLMLMGVLQGAITFSGRAMEKGKKLRKTYSSMFQEIPNTIGFTGAGKASYTFYAYNTEETVQGNQVFTIEADLGQKDVSYETADGSQDSTRFYLFGGGETP